MLIQLRHVTRYRYAPEALRLALRLTLFPGAHDGQRIVDWKVTANDARVPKLLDDFAGNGVGLWHRHETTDGVDIVAEGTIETTDTAGVIRDPDDQSRPEVWLRETRLTRPDEAIRALAEEIEGDSPLSRLHDLSRAVNEAIEYRQKVSDAKTTAAEAISRGAGVCQDQTHVFLSASRLMGIPARYVTGYLLTASLDEAIVPDTETHAWAEAHVPGLGWVGFDATHVLCPTDAYVRLSCGLDAADAAPIRGNVIGETEETLDVDLAITQASGQSQQ